MGLVIVDERLVERGLTEDPEIGEIVRIVGGTSQLLGNVVYDNVGAANNLPFAAAVATIPVVVMVGYLAAARRTGALENL